MLGKRSPSLKPGPGAGGDPSPAFASASQTVRFPAVERRQPAPLPKRPKGRLFVGVMLMAIIGVPTYVIWDTFFRFAAYGVVTGRSITVSSAWDGTVRTLHAREGDFVRQGQLLVTLDNLELEQKLARIGDEMRIAQAKLESDMSQLKWQSHAHDDHVQKAQAEYFELWGRLREEEAKLTELELKHQRAESLRDRKIVSAEASDAIKFSTSGQRQKVDKLRAAVEELRKRADLDKDRGVNDPREQLKPQIVKIDTLQAETERLRQQIKQGELVAPVDGRVIKRLAFPGELAKAGQPILEILEDGSLEAVLYLPQRQANHFEVGREVRLSVEPHEQEVTCRVTRLGDALEQAPASIARYYRSQEKLAPVYLHPSPSVMDSQALRLGSEVRLPTEWPSLRDWLHRIQGATHEPSKSDGGGTVGVSTQSVNSHASHSDT